MESPALCAGDTTSTQSHKTKLASQPFAVPHLRIHEFGTNVRSPSMQKTPPVSCKRSVLEQTQLANIDLITNVTELSIVFRDLDVTVNQPCQPMDASSLLLYGCSCACAHFPQKCEADQFWMNESNSVRSVSKKKKNNAHGASKSSFFKLWSSMHGVSCLRQDTDFFANSWYRSRLCSASRFMS